MKESEPFGWRAHLDSHPFNFVPILPSYYAKMEHPLVCQRHNYLVTPS
jgi:hypothetical protein